MGVRGGNFRFEIFEISDLKGGMTEDHGGRRHGGTEKAESWGTESLEKANGPK